MWNKKSSFLYTTTSGLWAHASNAVSDRAYVPSIPVSLIACVIIEFVFQLTIPQSLPANSATKRWNLPSAHCTMLPPHDPVRGETP